MRWRVTVSTLEAKDRSEDTKTLHRSNHPWLLTQKRKIVVVPTELSGHWV